MSLIKEISIVIPAYNDKEIIEDNIKTVLCKMRRLADRFEIILIDDYSTDGTREIIKELSLKHSEVVPIYHVENRGVGSGLRSGFDAARYDLVLTNCSDLPFDVDDLEQVVPFMTKERADICVMVRKDRSANTIFRKITSLVNYMIIRLLFRVPVRDFQFCQLYRNNVVKTIKPEARDVFVPPEMIIRAYDAGLRIVQFHAVFHPRTGGEAKYGKPKYFIATLIDQFRFWYRLRLRQSLSHGHV